MTRTRQLLCLLLSLTTILLTACANTGGIYANYRNIEELQLVDVIGLDFDDNGVTLSVSSGGLSKDSSPSVLSCHASSISNAMDEMQKYTSKEEFFYAHTRYIILGKSTAITSLEPILDYIERSPQMRPDTSLLILRDGKAFDLITESTNSEYNISKVLSSLERDIELAGNGKIFTIAEITQSLATSGSALACAISIGKTKDVVFSTDDATLALPDGYAFLKDGTLQGFLDPELAAAVNILQEYHGRTVLNLTDQEGNPVTVQLTSAHSSISPVWSKSKTLEAISISVKLTAAVLELSAEDNLYCESYLAILDKQLEEVLEARIRNVLLASRNYNADFLELGRSIRIKDPVLFEKMPIAWSEALGTVEFHLSVSGKVDRTYSITDPANNQGGGVSNAKA